MKGLRYIMFLEDCTATELADKLNVSQSLISLWATGNRQIPNKRLNDLVSIFPKYPIYFFDKELSDEDIEALKRIKKRGGIDTINKKLDKVQDVIDAQIEEQAKVLGDVAKILNVAEFSAALKNAQSLTDKELVMLLFTVVSTNQQTYIHDYRILNALERLRKNSPDDCKMPIISIVLSALATAFGINDDVSELAVSKSIRATMAVDVVKDYNAKQYAEWSNRLVSVFCEMFEVLEHQQKVIDEKNEMLRRKNEEKKLNVQLEKRRDKR